ncbi:DUF819 domain-containing protein [Bowmanella sp. JS7-9]|uniref:DUF819 domain-containing protein n=1 Tax=Pseudobowmanella zhangzhouensis TaxID=1537679 RepID=A0ABW1XIA8_9ALTE|nr:DUF819 family protein [Bowmanella sp. JS7-9]TBX27433.1 membrane protein [Bowmanella sp. JS7-9]
MHEPLITNDGIVMGLLAMILGGIFYTSQHRSFAGFYKFVPALLLCYFIPSLLNTWGIVDGDASKVYYFASRYLLPACLVLLTLSLDMKSIIALGPKALIMFLVGTLGIMIGGPIALLIISAVAPEAIGNFGPDQVWRGMTTIAGSWIGGGANQAAMKETFQVGNEIFSAMVTVDIIVANLWMAVLLLMASNAKQIDARTGADVQSIERIKVKVEAFEREHARIPSLNDLMLIIAVGIGAMGIAHWGADYIAPYIGTNFPGLKDFSLDSKFFWLIVIATIIGVSLSFTPASKLERAGASKIGSVFVYILVATIGLHMDITKIADSPIFFVMGIIWMLVHASLMLIVAWFIKAPVFYMAVGSQANVGGAASAPVVAAAFHPSLAPVGVLLAVLGYAVGTYGAYICGLIMQGVAG